MVLASLLSIGAPQVINCTTLITCSQCISTASCVWCSTLNSARCLSQENANSCRKDDLLQPATTIIDKQEIPLTENNQVSLKSIDLKLRVSEPVSFSVSLKAAENFPLDVYMLMDLSGSFREDLKTVKVLAPQLPLALRNVSSDFLIGFGTFVDKPSLPYTSSAQLNKVFVVLGQPSSCGSAIPCAKPFNYEHIISLTNSSDLFNSSVQETIISTNVDDPEDPLGAMLQAVVCNDLIAPHDCLLIPIWAIALLMLVGLVIIGIIILMFIKLIIMYLDYQEYQSFLKEVDETDLSNPIYHAPIVIP